MPYKDQATQREYQRVWYARRRYEWFKDKVCVDCGSDQELQLDHRDRRQKISHTIWSWSAERREAEIAKCDVRCRSCHEEKGRRVGDLGQFQKLTWEQVQEIRERYARGELQRDLASSYGVRQSYVSKVILHQRRPIEIPRER